ncbi:MAG: hypothetical protein R3B06_21785 [Kofleriaceae bacterium]
MSKLPESSLLIIGVVVGAAVGAGCKGTTTVKDNPETAANLAACSTKLADKDKLISTYEAELARLKLASANSNEWVVTIDGDALAIKARPTGSGAPPVDDKVAIELSQKFIELVRKSRGSIQKCYEQALKKNTSIQARTISLTVSAKYNGSGDVAGSNFRPDSLGSAFDSCMQAVAKGWKLPATAAGMSFQSTVSLSPS